MVVVSSAKIRLFSEIKMFCEIKCVSQGLWGDDVSFATCAYRKLLSLILDKNQGISSEVWWNEKKSVPLQPEKLICIIKIRKQADDNCNEPCHTVW